jgi:hypothetical protein
MRAIITDLQDDWNGLDERIERLSAEIKTMNQKEDHFQRPMNVPGYWPHHLNRNVGRD